MQVAQDESYRDPVNLQGKIQKHQAFEAELLANRKRVDAVSEVSGNDNGLLLSFIVSIVMISLYAREGRCDCVCKCKK